jgi:hypothetical protein
LDRKISELTELEETLAQSELELATLKAELGTFEAKYLRTVGVRLAEIDEINAQIAELEAKLKPTDNKIQEDAAKARAQAQESAEASGIAEELIREKFEPSENLKKLYREVAKRLHPDLAEDEKERLQRQKFMAEANSAYADGDEAKLRAILAKWEGSPESVKGEGTAAELVRVIRKISQVKIRLETIVLEIANLKNSDLCLLKTKVEKADDEGRDLLNEMALQLDKKIEKAKKRLSKIDLRRNDNE